jgi:hypothetical protein
MHIVDKARALVGFAFMRAGIWLSSNGTRQQFEDDEDDYPNVVTAEVTAAGKAMVYTQEQAPVEPVEQVRPLAGSLRARRMEGSR